MGNREIIAGAILCGGKARRFAGTPKGLIPIADGQTIIERLIGEFAQVGIADPVLLASDSADYDFLNHSVLPDRVVGQGPLGGIGAALAHFQGTADAIIFATCDMPSITAFELSQLMDAFRESTAKIVVAETCTFGWHPLCSVVHNGMIDQVDEALRSGKLAVHRLWRENAAEPISFSQEERFVNINTPEDLSQLRGESKEE